MRKEREGGCRVRNDLPSVEDEEVNDIQYVRVKSRGSSRCGTVDGVWIGGRIIVACVPLVPYKHHRRKASGGDDVRVCVYAYILCNKYTV